MPFLGVIAAVVGVLIIGAWFLINTDRQVDLPIGQEESEISTTTEETN